MFEVDWPAAGRWILVDADMGLLFRAGGQFLSAAEVAQRVKDDQRPEFFVLAQKAAETQTKYTLFLMTEHINAFDPQKIAALREQGHEFGVQPWVSAQPEVAAWRQGVSEIVSLFRERFGFAPRALRAHSCIFPGWDENPRLLAEHGLRLDTDLVFG